jgi:hypothetical protein
MVSPTLPYMKGLPEALRTLRTLRRVECTVQKCLLSAGHNRVVAGAGRNKALELLKQVASEMVRYENVLQSMIC